MGFLGDTESAEGSIDTDNDTQQADDGEQVQNVDTSAQEPTEGDKTYRDTGEKPVTVKLSRRQAAQQRQSEIADQIKELKNGFSSWQQQADSKYSTLAEENARMRGALEALARFGNQQQPQQGPKKTPDQMRREAQAALDAGKFDEWQNMFVESLKMEVQGMIPQQQAPVQQGPSPVVQAMLMQHPDVVNAGQRGIDLAVVEDQKLAIMGIPDGPQRYKMAFEAAALALKPKQQQAQYSQQARGALAGVPGSRGASGNGAGEPGIELTAYELSVARRCGMTPDEYAKYKAEAHPELVRNG